jgi:hypothetical protein
MSPMTLVRNSYTTDTVSLRLTFQMTVAPACIATLMRQQQSAMPQYFHVHITLNFGYYAATGGGQVLSKENKVQHGHQQSVQNQLQHNCHLLRTQK